MKKHLWGLPRGGTCTKTRPPPLVLAGGSLQLCLRPTLSPDSLDPDPDLPSGLPGGASDLPYGYSSLGHWAALVTPPAPLTHQSPPAQPWHGPDGEYVQGPEERLKDWD